jgi:hypothetical protein
MDVSASRYRWHSQCFWTKIVYYVDKVPFLRSFNHALHNIDMSRLEPGQLHFLINVPELIPIEFLEVAGRLLDFHCFHLSCLLSDIECLTPGTSSTLLGLSSREPDGPCASRSGNARSVLGVAHARPECRPIAHAHHHSRSLLERGAACSTSLSRDCPVVAVCRGCCCWDSARASAAAGACRNCFRRTSDLCVYARHSYFCCARLSTGKSGRLWARRCRAASRVFWGARTTLRMGHSGTNGQSDSCTRDRSS